MDTCSFSRVTRAFVDLLTLNSVGVVALQPVNCWENDFHLCWSLTICCQILLRLSETLRSLLLRWAHCPVWFPFLLQFRQPWRFSPWKFVWGVCETLNLWDWWKFSPSKFIVILRGLLSLLIQAQIKSYMTMLLKGVVYLHGKSIMHRVKI